MMRVLIADDHAVFRQGLINLLKGSEDIEIVGDAHDGRMAMNLIAETKPDVAILDISMPGPDGIEVTRESRRQSPATKIVLLTMHKDPAMPKLALAAGAAGYILKEDAFEDLVYALRKISSGGTYISSSIVHEVISASGPGQYHPATLSPREIEVLGFISKGLTNKQIAAMLKLSVKTVETHRSRIMRKLDIHTTAELVRFAIRRGLA